MVWPCNMASPLAGGGRASEEMVTVLSLSSRSNAMPPETLDTISEPGHTCIPWAPREIHQVLRFLVACGCDTDFIEL